MIGLEDVYKVVVAVIPLYVALVLGYGSVRWWNIFTKEQCEAINKLVCYFTLPLFTFEFTAHIDPFKMNFLFIAADTLSKFIIMMVLALWAKCSSKGSFCWSITSFSLCTLTNALVVGVPMVKAMYGPLGVDLVVQSSVVQAIIWLTLLLFVLEFRRAGIEGTINLKSTKTTTIDNHSNVMGEGGRGKDIEATPTTVAMDVNQELMLDDTISNRPPFCKLMKHVWLKLVMNPNSYGCVIGISWAFVSNSVHAGIFMALQEKLIACGPSLTVFGLVLKFIAGPAAMAISAIVVGLRGDVLRVAIIQAAVPQSITSFIYAKEYGLHPEVLSTAVIFGMIVSLPVLVGYYAILEFIH
ncbi:auxin efflux carrier component 5 isoform X2 [Abrus precatorius]|uniref:Auxin efflux carrier component 5 isoform X2 n=1 Tax=Abrus precatorius TaxID=3816 RepID=A0A8B8LBM4_ABRPR|nr:auxin efflux carrier component 5 isoform X2 [Abrus precatorius]